MFTCENFENFKNTSFEEHLWTTASERFSKISSLLVLGKSILDSKQHNWVTNAFYWKYEPHEVSLCNIQSFRLHAKVAMITILKYLELPIVVEQFIR